jgi:hypothetical protein
MGSRSIILAVALIIFTVILAIALVVGRFRTGKSVEKKVEETVTQEAPRDTVEVVDIINDPMVYNGVNLEIDSEITGWATNRAFYFSATFGGGFGGGQKRSLLVVAKEPFTLPQDPNDDKVGLGETTKVKSKGKIEVMNEEQLEKTLGVYFYDKNNSLYENILINFNIHNYTITLLLTKY